MTILLRFIPRVGGTVDASRDRTFNESEIKIGRAPDCEIRLFYEDLRFHHAVIKENSDLGLIVEAVNGAKVEVNGHAMTRALLAKPGDKVKVGCLILTLAPGVEGNEAKWVLTLVPDTKETLSEEDRVKSYAELLAVKLPNVRLWAFCLTLLILGLFLITPFVYRPVHEQAPSTPMVAEKTISQAMFHPISLWNVGRISSGHEAFGTDCAMCHQKSFIRVEAQSCRACHKTVGYHADPHIAEALDISQERCESCHHEHKGEVLATSNQENDCVSCHGDIKSIAPESKMKNVHDLGHDHPEFKATLIQDADTMAKARFEIGDKSAVDHSNLIFTHAKHLKLDKFKKLAETSDNVCGSCHEPILGGVTFKPVKFDPSCAECHKLQFEPTHPEWRLPHGHAEDVAASIAGFYARAALSGETFPEPKSDLFAKPGAPLPPPPAHGAEMVSYQTASAMMSSIARSACGQCHVTVPPEQGADPTQWNVKHVAVTDHYFPKARFTHSPHGTVPCATCHLATTQDGGPMALLPGIDTCKACHAGDAGSNQRLTTTCVSCHGYHSPEHPFNDKEAKADPVSLPPLSTQSEKKE